MRKTITVIFIAMFAALTCPGVAPAVPDQFIGDTAIYGGQVSILQPNILIILDNSGSMDGEIPGAPYDPAVTYDTTNHCDGNCSKDAVYRTKDGGWSSSDFINVNVANITTSCSGGYNPRNILQTKGIFSGRRLYTDGSCDNNKNRDYVTGNYINWMNSPAAAERPKIDVAREVVKNLISTTVGVKFGLMKFRGDNQGSQLMNPSVAGVSYLTTIKDMDEIHTATTTNRSALMAAVDTIDTGPATPLGESLFEGMRYFQGGATAFSNTNGISSGTYTSPILYTCQKNYVIFVTDGMATADGSAVLDLPLTTYGRLDGGFCVGYGSPAYTYCNSNCDTGYGGNTRCHSLAGIAKYMNEHDLKTLQTLTTNATQNNVITYTIGFGLGGADQDAVELLRLAADINHGRGKDFLAGSETELSGALKSVIADIFSEDSAFVAPVVPVNPENKYQFGSRVYMGFFKPLESGFWSGNLKKFGLDTNLNIVDKTSALATYVDADGNNTDDRDGAPLSNDAVDGSFRSSATSYWSVSVDSGDVEKGGVGALLKSRDFTISCTTCNIAGTKPRKIYTYMGTANKDLTHSDNSFSTANALITAASLGLPGPIISTGTTDDAKKLINYVHGFNVYSSVTASTTIKRDWILGDVLHSKPQVVSYATFTYSHDAICSGDESNQNMIYVGTNDGMLHAFKDCDGSEAWAFIPPALLPNLQYIKGPNHTYFVDSTAQVYKYLKNVGDDNAIGATINPGPLSSVKKDSVILLVGLRRGGGVTTEPGKGYYYALDVTDPATPKLLWQISNSSATFADLGEAWSEPKIGKIAVGTSIKLAVFLGGGYDNCNEDGRFGATQYFTGSCVGVLATNDSGLDGLGNPRTSIGSTPYSAFTTTDSYKGRAVYVVELATFPTSTSTNGLDFSNSGTKIWGYTFKSDPALRFSMLSEMAAVDLTGEGYVDRLYMGDSGGNMWRFNLSSTNTAAWSVNRIFRSSSSIGTDDAPGRKIFYRPAVVPDAGGSIVRIYFGTGDREHPLNRAVTDRIYGLIDKGQSSTSVVSESKLLDVTDDLIQAGTAVQQQSVKDTLAVASNVTDTTQYGWYIRLDGQDRSPAVSYPGEKVLAGVSVAAGTVFATTYSPMTEVTGTADPCRLGNLGEGRLYALDYLSGAAVKDYDPTNNTADQDKLRTDRWRRIGDSIPSSAVVICIAGNADCKWLVGCGGGICSDDAKLSPGSLVAPVYWRQK